MRLNYECIRDILFEVEEHSTLENSLICPKEFSKKITAKYSNSELGYHLRQCHLSGLLISDGKFDWDFNLQVIDLSPAGHEFIANVREDTAWNKTKECAKKIGASSLNSMIQIASSLISKLIANYFSANI